MSVLQGGVHRVQERPEEPARAHRSPPGGQLQQEGGGQVIHWQEVKEITRIERIGAHSHIRGLGLDDSLDRAGGGPESSWSCGGNGEGRQDCRQSNTVSGYTGDWQDSHSYGNGTGEIFIMSK